jgi:hypothetical protein
MLTANLRDSRDASVGTAITSEVQFTAGTRLTAQRRYPLWGPPRLLANGYPRLFPGLKRPGREADHSPQSSGDVKNGEAISLLNHKF